MDFILLGKILQQARVNAGKTQKDISRILGVTDSNISSWERGKSKIDIDTYLEICNIYDIAPDVPLKQIAEDTPKKINDDFIFTSHEKELIKKFRELDERGKSTVLSVLDQQYDFLDKTLYENDRAAFIKKHAQPYAAADGDTSNLEEAQRLFDESDYVDEDEGQE